jgi:hypothetical protein
MLSAVMLIVFMLRCLNAECGYAECRVAKRTCKYTLKGLVNVGTWG